MSRDPSYRGEVREAVRGAHWTFWKVLPLTIVVLAVVAMIGVGFFWAFKSSEIVTKNIEREVTQQSQQYTESQQAALQNLYTEYVRLQTDAVKAKAGDQPEIAKAIEAQQIAILAQMRRKTTNIFSSEIPEEVRVLLDRAKR